jgi:diadenosine tetraphosphatase ApaH/serine/threonine PP2A family protein phosphatase
MSVVGESSLLCDNWCKENLQPMLKSHQELAAAATSRKIAVLRNALIATLETRLRAGGQFIAGEELKSEEVLNAFREVEKSFDKIVLRSCELGQGISGQAPLIIKATVERFVASWRKRSCEQSSEILTETIIEVLARPIAQMEEEYEGMLYFLRSLQPIDSFEMFGKRCVACHAAPSDPLFRYLRTGEKDLANEIMLAGSPDYLFFGHTHWSLLKRIGGTTIVNPGSVGQPKDGDARAGYAVWQDGTVELRRVAYPIEVTVKAYDRTRLASSDVKSLIAVLRTGGTLPSDVAEMASR